MVAVNTDPLLEHRQLISSSTEHLPVGILTGFLGGGKTTLLRRWFSEAASVAEQSETAVLINEFGATGLDHLLVGRIDSDTVLLDNGCICCAVRGDLKNALLRLLGQRERREIPAFKRVVIETTGLAAPGPVLATLLADQQLAFHYRPAYVFTVVDVVNGANQRARHPEWLAQVAAADTLCLSKLDLASHDQAQDIRACLSELNPLARIVDARTQSAPWHDEHLNYPFSEDSLRWFLRASAGMLAQRKIDLAGSHSRLTISTEEHTGQSQALSIEFEDTVDWVILTLWLTLVVHRYGDRILRIKGLLRVDAPGWPQGQPTVLHGVGHLMHPPEHLEKWPDPSNHHSRIVFIAEGLDEVRLKASWQSFKRSFE